MILVISLGYEKRYVKKEKQKLKNDLYYYLRGFLCLGSSFFFFFFLFKTIPTSICLSRDKTKGQSGKNTTITPTKTLPKK